MQGERNMRVGSGALRSQMHHVPHGLAISLCVFAGRYLQILQKNSELLIFLEAWHLSRLLQWFLYL